MRAIVQRVSEASVVISGETVAETGTGLLILLGIEETDTDDDLAWLAAKVARMRIFADPEGKMNLGMLDLPEAGAIVVSQFTLHASTRKGNRPSFIRAARPEHSEPLYEAFCARLEEESGRTVGRGRFGANMKVRLINDGPVTILIDSKLRE
ncbi:D-aminoacyl-tRNA deacylase [Haloferula helveola]|uniref:D-aminoacyl-tRNA deacylase n=1 Tax=Haloferula helveola TaxID=490095 RepID=A0ABM7RKH0_9BACT|nr:D-aminoacyl-tRNA deacylase [Haloferula helveola]